MTDVAIDLERFERHHPEDFDGALGEMEAGRKRSHWMWFVFPQLTSLGCSDTARKYGINNADEAAAYLNHPVLSHDYARIVEVVWRQVVGHGVNPTDLMGSPDDVKLVSSLTLFGTVARRTGDPHFAELADRCDDILVAAHEHGFDPCSTTLDVLARAVTSPPPPPKS